MADRGETESLFPGRLFHLGVVVADLERGMEEWTGALGVSWRTLFSGEADIDRGGTVTTMAVPAVYSADGPVHLELITVVPGTVWDVPGLHHAGFWSDDIPADRDRLVARGASVEAQIRRDGHLLAVYLMLSGSRVELIASASRERLTGS
jgi:hypothetical protein